MSVVWPRRASGLPPGQRLLGEMPRFTDKPFAAPPPSPPDLDLTISVDRAPRAVVGPDLLASLGPREFVADFHCVTTWSVTGLVWTGTPLCEVFAAVGIEAPPAPYLVARSTDHRRGHFLATDAFADDVIVATHLDGQPLAARHGGPVRLVAPRHYGYKSIKHLIALEFRSDPPQRLGKEHLRGRVDQEERHPTWPGWLLRIPYRLLIPPTAFLAERAIH
ncbi:MAG: molybdopterin-dependent oxidoreductase [Acidimicrobiia bacterium]